MVAEPLTAETGAVTGAATSAASPTLTPDQRRDYILRREALIDHNLGNHVVRLIHANPDDSDAINSGNTISINLNAVTDATVLQIYNMVLAKEGGIGAE
jgi:hypothetical protein